VPKIGESHLLLNEQLLIPEFNYRSNLLHLRNIRNYVKASRTPFIISFAIAIVAFSYFNLKSPSYS